MNNSTIARRAALAAVLSSLGCEPASPPPIPVGSNDPCTIQLMERIDARLPQISQGAPLSESEVLLVSLQSVPPENQRCAFATRLAACCARGSLCSQRALGMVADLATRTCEPGPTPQATCIARCDMQAQASADIVSAIIAMCIGESPKRCQAQCTGMGNDMGRCLEICDLDFRTYLGKTNRQYFTERCQAAAGGSELGRISKRAQCRDRCMSQ